MDSLHKGPVTLKVFLCPNIIMHLSVFTTMPVSTHTLVANPNQVLFLKRTKIFEAHFTSWSISHKFASSSLKSCETFLFFDYDSNDQIRLQICTCHDRWAVVIWSDHNFSLTTTQIEDTLENLERFVLWAQTNLRKWSPIHKYGVDSIQGSTSQIV